MRRISNQAGTWRFFGFVPVFEPGRGAPQKLSGIGLQSRFLDLIRFDGVLARIRVDDREFSASGLPANASIAATEADVYSVLWEGRSYEVRVSGNTYQVNGKIFQVEVDDPRDASRHRSNSVTSGQQRVTAPMPGRVVRLLVAPGSTVSAGQGIIIIEAMKMQNELKALRAGTISSLPVATGNAVAAGDLLAVID